MDLLLLVALKDVAAMLVLCRQLSQLCLKCTFGEITGGMSTMEVVETVLTMKV